MTDSTNYIKGKMTEKETPDIKKKVNILGSKVQDVGYRLFLYKEAENETIAKFEANNSDEKGKVEVLLGDEKDKIEKFIEFIRHNYPKNAIVDKDSINVEDYDGEIMLRESFYRKLTTSQLEKMTEIGTEMLKKQDKERNEYIFEPTKTIENYYITRRTPENIRLEKSSSIIELDKYSQNEWKYIDEEIKVQIIENGIVNKEFILEPTPAGQGRFTLLSATESISRNSILGIFYEKKAEKLRMKIRN